MLLLDTRDRGRGGREVYEGKRRCGRDKSGEGGFAGAGETAGLEDDGTGIGGCASEKREERCGDGGRVKRDCCRPRGSGC